MYSLDQEGVTSISLDHHKFGLAPKGVSTIFYKTEELRHAQYYVNTDWVGGLYETPTIPGSKSGFAVAAAWHSLRLQERGSNRMQSVSLKPHRNAQNNERKLKSFAFLENPKCVLCLLQSQTQKYLF